MEQSSRHCCHSYLLSFRRQLAKFDLSSFCVNFRFSFFIYILCVTTIVITVLSMHFIGVSGLRVFPLLTNGIEYIQLY